MQNSMRTQLYFEEMQALNQLVLTTNCSFKINAVPWTVGLGNSQWESFITHFLC